MSVHFYYLKFQKWGVGAKVIQYSVECRQNNVLDEMTKFWVKTVAIISSFCVSENVIKDYLINIYNKNGSNVSHLTKNQDLKNVITS